MAVQRVFGEYKAPGGGANNENIDIQYKQFCTAYKEVDRYPPKIKSKQKGTKGDSMKNARRRKTISNFYGKGSEGTGLKQQMNDTR